MNILIRTSVLATLLASSASATWLYVADPDDGSVSTVTQGGGITPLITGLASPRALAFRASGELLVADNDQILRFDAATGASLGVFAALAGVDAIVVDLLGNVFAASSTGGELRKYDSAGSPVATVSGLDTPGALALDDQGRLFVAANDSGNGIQGFRYLASDLSLVGVFVTAGLNVPMSATYRGNTLYIADLFGGVDQVDTSGVVSPFAATDLNFPWGVAFDPSGNLYVASSLDGKIQVFDGAGVFQSTLTSGFVTPAALAFSPVPEPGTLVLLGGGAALLAASRGASRVSNRRG